MKLSNAILLVASCLFAAAPMVAGQSEPNATCAESIVDEASCQSACSGGTNLDPGAFDFIVDSMLIDGGTASQYTGFSCECAAADPPVFCEYAFEFPTCSSVGVTDCTTSTVECGDYCVEIGFTTGGACYSNTAVSPAAISCTCDTDFLNANEMEESSIFTCGDPGWEGGTEVTTASGPKGAVAVGLLSAMAAVAGSAFALMV